MKAKTDVETDINLKNACKLLVFEGNNLTHRETFASEPAPFLNGQNPPSFVFIQLGEELFYFDSTKLEMRLTDVETLENLGEGHKQELRKYL